MKLSSETQSVTNDGSLLVVVRQGYSSNWQMTAREKPTQEGMKGTPIPLTGWSIVTEGEYRMGILGANDEDVTLGELISGKSKRSLTVVVNNDQTNNPGVFTMLIPKDLWTDPIMADADEVPCFAGYTVMSRGNETRIATFIIALRRGFAEDGPTGG